MIYVEQPPGVVTIDPYRDAAVSIAARASAAALVARAVAGFPRRRAEGDPGLLVRAQKFGEHPDWADLLLRD